MPTTRSGRRIGGVKRVRKLHAAQGSSAPKAPRKAWVTDSELTAMSVDACFDRINAPPSWVCDERGTTEDLYLVLATGAILQKDLAARQARSSACPLILALNEPAHPVILVHSRRQVDVSREIVEGSVLHRMRATLAKLQRVSAPAVGARRRWGRIRALVHFLTLPSFSLAARRARRVESLKHAALFRMRNLSLAKAFSAWKGHRQAHAEPAWDPRAGFTGLDNLGNTCYMNSVLQCLLHSPTFLSALGIHPGGLGRSALRPPSKHRPLLGAAPPAQAILSEELRDLALQTLAVRKLAAFSPDDFLAAQWRLFPQFVGFQQQDAHEFFVAALSRLQDERLPGVPTSMATACAYAETSHIECHACGHRRSSTCASAGPLSLDLPPLPPSHRRRKHRLHLQDLVAHRYDTQEQFPHGLDCPGCGKREPATRTLSLSTLPTVLVIHIPRTSWRGGGRKLLEPVDAVSKPLLLGPSQDTGKPASYTCTGVIVHHGRQMGGGHYTAYCKSLSGTAWLHFNDSKVKQVPEEHVAALQAYLCVFEAEDAAMVGP